MDCGTPTESLLNIKLLLNNIISIPVEKFLGLDLKDFYLNTPMERLEFLRIKVSNFLEDVNEHYKLQEKVDDKGFVYVKYVYRMYGLLHTGIIYQKLLKQQLEKHGYCQSDKMSGFWKHDTGPSRFTLLVDDFGVKYVGKKHANHRINVLKEQ